MNAADIIWTLGTYMPGVEPPFNCGFEGVGTVVAAGDKAKLQESQLEKFLLFCNPLYPDYWNTLNNSFSSIFYISKTFGHLTPHLLELNYFRLKEKLFNPVHLFYVARFFSKICVLCSFITVEN